jgi:hypothetical protein
MADAPPRIRNVFLSIDPSEREYEHAAHAVLVSLNLVMNRPTYRDAALTRGEMQGMMAGCDAFVLVMIQPYVLPGEFSNLELEYGYAVEARVPVLVFLYQHEDTHERKRTPALVQFRQRLMARHQVTFFASVNDFSQRLTAALQRLQAEGSAPAGTPAADAPPHDDPRGTPAETVVLQPDLFSSGVEYVLHGAALWAASGQTPALVSTHLLLFALDELGRLGSGSRWAGDFFRQHLGALGASWYTRRDDWLREHGLADRIPPPGGRELSAEVKVTPAALRLMNRARQIAAATSGVEVTSGRHLAAALLTEASGALEYLSVPSGIPEPALLRERLFAWVRGYGDDDEAWRAILVGGAPPTLHLARFDADDVRAGDLRKRDLLGIERDVLAFATLMGSRALAPPLSIGLFGEWGSGKTFFMRRLREEVDELSARARNSGKPQGALDFYKHVVQIEFNAWQYVEGNLWASLVEHIFRNLHVGDEPGGMVEKMQQHWMEQLEFEKQAVDAAQKRTDDADALVNDAQARLDEAERVHREKAAELGELSRENVERAFVLSGAKPVVDGLVETLGLRPLGAAAGELQASLNQARAVLQRGGAALTPLLRAEDRRRRAVWLAAILFGAPLLGGAIAIFLRALGKDVIGEIVGFATGTATLLGFLADWLRRQTAWVTEKIAAVEEAQKTYDAELAARQAETAKEIAARQQELALVREQYTVALQVRDEAARRAAQAERELRQVTAGRILARFVEDRAASTDYRKHLGVLAVIRDDFERLSKLIEAENTRLATLGDTADEAAGETTRINRIVLYIDDLDRCPPAKVVEVLQAVHLLLAFPLFVVVVGVDARWVSRSLESRYRELLHTGGPDQAAELRRSFDMASTGDYLEKIFQVPFWVQPMDAEGSRRLLRRIFTGGRATSAPDLSREADGAADPSPTRAGDAPDTSASGGSATPERQGQADRPLTFESAAARAGDGGGALGTAASTGREEQAVYIPSAESLEIGGDELRFIDALAPLLGRSPRALKRFANVYRLMKAGLTPAERVGFMKGLDFRMAGYQAVLFLLAVDTGLPELAPHFFDLVMQGAATRPWETPPPEDEEAPEDENARDPTRYQRDWLLAELEKRVAADGPEREQLRTLDRWLESYRGQMEEWAAVYHLSRWAPRVSQFSFQPPARTHAGAA